jgi:ABC-2 type transport system ATP-binding protein
VTPNGKVTSSPVIRTEQLTKRFVGIEALDRLSIEIPRGAVFALIGPNGAGKTTAIKTIINILRPTSGHAEVLGVDSRTLGPEQLSQIGYVSENQLLPEWMRVDYFLSYCKPFYPTWNDDELDALVRSYELPLDRTLKALSRGMRLKAALASSLAYRPRLIVLDEPFSGLDMLVREQLIESILERTPESTVLLASHDLAEIESFASHVAYLDGGRLQFVEEMGALSERFREVEVTLENAVDLPRELPDHWLNPEGSLVVIRFTDSQFNPHRNESDIRSLFPGVRDIATHTLPLRSIFVALAKAAKKARMAR